MHLETFAEDRLRTDPIRLIEAVTSGTAFLAAGLIVFKKGHVKGLTTGAGMWLAGAIGVACGLEIWQIAIPTAVLGIVALSFLLTAEKRIFDKRRQISRHRDEAVKAMSYTEDQNSR